MRLYVHSLSLFTDFNSFSSRISYRLIWSFLIRKISTVSMKTNSRSFIHDSFNVTSSWKKKVRKREILNYWVRKKINPLKDFKSYAKVIRATGTSTYTKWWTPAYTKSKFTCPAHWERLLPFVVSVFRCFPFSTIARHPLLLINILITILQYPSDGENEQNLY